MSRGVRADAATDAAPDRRPPRHERLVVAGAAVFAGLSVLVATRHGVGANGTDSVAYLTMADDVAAGRMPYPTVIGVPPTHLPPGWSVLVGGLVAILPGADALEVARFVNVAFAALLPVVVFVAVRSRASRPSWMPALVALVIGTSYPLFELASRAVVEAFFLVLLVVVLLAVERFARTPTRGWLLISASLMSALTLTRFVGAAALVPLALAVVVEVPGWLRRVAWVAVAGLIALGPAVAWYLLEPGSPVSSHVRGDRRAGAGELVLSVREAGVTLVRGAYLPAVLQAVIGLALLATPVAAVVLTGRATAQGGTWRRRWADVVEAKGLGPWLWYLVGYTAIVAVQRWSIDREVISRYWLPYWTVAAVILGRCLVDWVGHPSPSWRRAASVASVGLLAVSAYNVAQVAVTTRDDARDGVTINAQRYQDSPALDALAEQRPDLVRSDHVQLVELQLYARGALAPIERLSCDVDRLDELAAAVAADQRRGRTTAFAVAGRCRGGPLLDALRDRFDGAVVVDDPQVGAVVLLPEG